MALLDRVGGFAHRHDLWRPDTRVVAAVSGGSDSVALLLLLRDLAAAGGVILDAIAHLNHGIRGDAADDDQRFCEQLALQLNVPIVCDRVDVPGAAAAANHSIEVEGRLARKAFYRRVLETRGADRVATAHTLDDQAETILLRLVRGAALRGLGGIRPRSDHLVRPLLDCRRDELRDELRLRHQPWREDATNHDLDNPRNRMRHDVLPYLAQHFNPSAAAALARFADHARADDDFLAHEAAVLGSRLLKTAATGSMIDAQSLVALPAALGRRVVRTALETVHPGASYGLEDVDAVRRVAAGVERAVEFGAVRAERFGTNVVLVNRASGSAPESFAYDLAIPGAVESAHGGWRLEAEGPLAGAPERSSHLAGSIPRDPLGDPLGQQVALEAAGLGSRLIVRSRRPGDRMRPLGVGGYKKLQDLFVDRKVSRDDRGRIPVVTHETGRIVWVPGHALDEEFRVTDRTTSVVILKLRSIAHPPAAGRGKQ